MTIILNGPLIKQRRIEASLGHKHAADILGVGSVLLTRIERGDDVHKSVSVIGLLALAEAIGCTPTELFLDTSETTSAPGDNVDRKTSGRSTVTPELLIGVLRETTTQITLKDLAAAFECTNHDIRAAVEQAQTRLEGTGLRIATRDYQYFLTSTQQAAVADVRQRIDSTAAARHGMDNGQARILTQVLDGQLRAGRRSLYTNSMLAYLTRLGILTENESGNGYQPSEALAYALDVT